ncbi:MAG: tRNA (adenosine(37)-N6)-threonylcarbamoyltransferase complex dimerization subunit type 1 TsaB [Magnetococcales bacterium]|nr:tRNA (adenosine(37)-N6)-threonylcarbamoyltransferase complex dimerization subunit type 1 TsaB [Magnetococcales bacterium]
MNILALDTATPLGGAALLLRGEPVEHVRFEAGEGHVAKLPEAVDGLLSKAGWSYEELGLIAVTVGPGSFAGVRVALGFAKGLALANNTPLVGVSTLMVVAAGAGIGSDVMRPDVVAVMDARKGEVFSARYRFDETGFPSEYWPPGCWLPSSLASSLGPARTLMTGDGLRAHEAVFKEHMGKRFKTAPEENWAPHPMVLGVLGLRLFEARGATPAEELEPVYLRVPEAERHKKAAQAQAAASEAKSGDAPSQ